MGGQSFRHGVVAPSNTIDSTAPDAFSMALRAAIRASGLSLDRVQYRLRSRGVSISVTALSYWQSGRRRPERPESLAALTHLECVLGVAPGALTALLGPPRPRGRTQRTPSHPPIDALWSNRERVSTLLSRINIESDTALNRISQHDRVEIGPGRGERTVRVRQVLQAQQDGADRWVLVFDVARPGKPFPEIVPLQSCRIGRVAQDEDAGLIVAELPFDRPLAKDETVIMEYQLEFPGPPYARGDDSFSRKFRLPVRDYVVELRFDPNDLPSRCERFELGTGEEELGQCRDLVVEASGHAHAVALGFGPGTFGVRWGWNSE
jgi:hypothetical protein